MADSSFQPFVPPEKTIPEFTFLAVASGAFLGLIFAASSLYLVLKVGMTVSASIPVAVLAITVFRALSRMFGFRPATILENNIVQTAGSAGESIAFGVGVSMPALLLLGYGMDLPRVMTVSILGGILGILAMIPLRRAFIVKMHGRPGQPGTLLYPEGTACAQVLISGEKGGSTGVTVFAGFGLAFLHKFLTGEDGMALLASTVKKPILWINKSAVAAMELAPELLGVGYIIGLRTSAMMMGGAVLGYLVIIPIIYFIGEHATTAIPPGKMPIRDMEIKDIRNSYLLYIGAGTVASAGIISMLKTLPMILSGLRSSLGASRQSSAIEVSTTSSRTDRDMPMATVLIGSAALILFLAAFLATDVGIIAAISGAALVVAFGFLFVTVSARLTGEIGSSSNPISGMTTATLMVTCLIFAALGWTSPAERVLALSIAAVVCVASSNGGTVAQSLKTGHILGGTPKAMQYAILVGALVSALAIGGTLIYGLNNPGTVHSARPENLPKLTLTKDEVARLSQTESYGEPKKLYRIFDTRNGELTEPAENYTPRAELLAIRRGEGSKLSRFLVDPETGRLEYARDDAIMGKLKERDDGTAVARNFDAPKTQVMGIIINGVLKKELNWTMVAIGAMIALMLELCGVSALAFAVGLYVPIQSSTPIFIGGLVRWLIDKRQSVRTARELTAAGSDPEARALVEIEALRRSETSPGVLLASGYIAGGSIAGVLCCFLAFDATFQQDLKLFQYSQVAITTEATLQNAAIEAAKITQPNATETEQLELAKEIKELNGDLPKMAIPIRAGTNVKYPGRTEPIAVASDTTYGQLAAKEMGRDWKAGTLLERNFETEELEKMINATKLPTGTKLNLPQRQWPAVLAFSILAAILYFIARRTE